MKKLKQIFAVAALAFCCSMAVKADTQAAQITGVKQVDDSSSSVSVSCEIDPNTRYYMAELSTDNITWTTKNASLTPNSIKISGLAAGRTYYVRVVGASDYEYGTYTYTPTTTPSDSIEAVTAPASSKASQSNATTSSVSVKFDDSSEANWYMLFYNEQVIGQGSSPTVTTSTRLNAGTEYRIQAYACRKSKTGYIANEYYSTGTVKTLAPKIDKSNFGFEYLWTNLDSYKVITSNNYAVDGYYYEFQTTSGKVVKTASGSSDSQFINNLQGTFYKYRVRTYVMCGTKPVYSAWSDFKTIAMPKKNTIKGKCPRGKALKIKLNWGKVSGASGYVIYTSNKPSSGYKKVKTLSAKKRSITISKVKGKKLKKNKTYYVRIVPKAKKLGNAMDYITWSGKIVPGGSY